MTDSSSLADTFWERHANPKSGWSRVLIGPLVLLALYRRDVRALGVAAVALVVNPVLFPRAETADEESWMTRGVHAERWWLERGEGTIGLGWPNVLNTLNVPTFAYALYAAYTKKGVRALLAYAASMALKFAWIELVARRYDRREA
ncbi:DUF6653 family protein [Halarchaeum sp. P4]|uniref:DUF6653 family protein n=1 Tax=Halarchaeum sp. P4 TaxID=3421639 RepID=UPI003EBBF018